MISVTIASNDTTNFMNSNVENESNKSGIS